ncbi:hypothetical protein ONZ45_g14699 [Pleurotus djamor]|nr:hypothetical protein ONZ45_g14699 [Pleurotus djamor]
MSNSPVQLYAISPYTPLKTFEDTLEDASVTLKKATERVEEILKRRIYVNKALIDGFETLIPVSVFVAGVQGQVVASSLTANFDSVSVAANWFAFNGLVLDILGTAFGSMRLLSLQRSTRGAVRNQDHVTKAHGLLEDKINLIKAHSDQNRVPSDGEIRSLQDALKKYETMMDDIHSLYESSFPSLLDLTPVNIIPARGIIRWATDKSSLLHGGFERVNGFLDDFITPQLRRPRSTIPDQVPIVVMAFGIIFLLLSVILRAVSTQFRRVWLGCIIITGIVCLYASPGIMNTDEGHPNRQERKVNKEIDELRGLLGTETKLTN